MNVMAAQAKELVELSKPELVDIIFGLRNTVSALQIQITELKAKGKSSDDQAPKPAKEHPSWLKANKKRKHKKTRKTRKENYARTRSEPTKKVYHSFSTCPNCGGILGAGHTGYIREIIEIPLVPVEVTHHIVLRRRCLDCKARVMPKIDFSAFAPNKQRFGVRLTSLITFLREECQQPLPKIQKYLSLVHNFFISQGGIVRLLDQIASFGKPHYKQIKQEIRKSPWVYADETGGRENGKNGYHWNFNTEKIQYVVYRRSRKNKIVSHVLGDSFEGVVSSDFYTAYNIHEGFHQRCWVHLTRDIKDLVELLPKNWKLKIWAKQVKKIYEEAKAYIGPDPGLPVGLQEQERVRKQQYFEKKLREIVWPHVKTETPMAGLSARMIRFLPELFVFIRIPGGGSDNNPAERAVRHLVTWRKISGGTRSPKGSETKSILTSLFGTWRLQGINPFLQCQLLLTGKLPLSQ